MGRLLPTVLRIQGWIYPGERYSPETDHEYAEPYEGKTIVCTGGMKPMGGWREKRHSEEFEDSPPRRNGRGEIDHLRRCKPSDSAANLVFSTHMLQDGELPAGVYVAMHQKLYDPSGVRKHHRTLSMSGEALREMEELELPTGRMGHARQTRAESPSR